MRTETEAAEPDSGLTCPGGILRAAGGNPAAPPRPRRILWVCVLLWTLFVCLALWWLWNGNGALSVWIFQDRDLAQPGFAEKVQSIFRGELRLQRAYPWILFGPYLALLAWHFPLERERLRRTLPLHAAACLAFVWACHAINLRTNETDHRMLLVTSDLLAPGMPPAGTSSFIRDPDLSAADPLPDDLRPRLPPRHGRRVSLRSTGLDVLACGAMMALFHSITFYRRLRDRERRALFLESNLARARLNTLKAQLQPHFLFNSLNAIAALLRRDPRLAESTLVSLSELLRLALSLSERQELALREELDFVRRYLEIQQTRFGEKLRVEQNIDPRTLDCTVPALVLQPLVENAIRHGIEPAEKPGTVRVSAFASNGHLLLTVEDDGVGLPNPSPHPEDPLTRPGTGIGLSNLRERLNALYGTRQKIELTPRTPGGVTVRVEIPFHLGA